MLHLSLPNLQLYLYILSTSKLNKLQFYTHIPRSLSSCQISKPTFLICSNPTYSKVHLNHMRSVITCEIFHVYLFLLLFSSQKSTGTHPRTWTLPLGGFNKQLNGNSPSLEGVDHGRINGTHGIFTLHLTMKINHPCR